MRRFFLCLGFVPFFFASCRNETKVAGNFFDSLVTAQVSSLSAAHAVLTKTARIGQKDDAITLTPSLLDWENELDAFRQLAAFERPAFRSAYVVADGIKDPGSNLLMRTYHTDKKVPVRMLRFFYLKNFGSLKKIEAVYAEQNALYSSTRTMTMDFEDLNGASSLTGYRLDGVQKMTLSDSVYFFIHASVRR